MKTFLAEMAGKLVPEEAGMGIAVGRGMTGGADVAKFGRMGGVSWT
ncbi:MAG TPA: hypothetical protein VJ327_04940 [Patescibacteria group bacterium]|nr:hypothetical protein [Patescibacteria group bacterium]